MESPERARRPYKWKRTMAPPEEWRQRLLKQCLHRIKCDRENELRNRRKGRMRIIEEEVARLRPQEEFLSEDDLEALIADLEAAMDAERREAERNLIEAEEKMIQDFERLGREQAEFDTELFAFHEQNDAADAAQVLCPVCERGKLHVREGVVFCRCGVRIDGGTCDNLTTDIVKERLEQVFAKHANCGSSPKFDVRHNFGTFLWAHCRCGDDLIVL
ncbi:RPA-interacting protein [Gracilaria domingensis]|nr:RPA-interacting protein [Gracilaria domingensis]